jgi:hypothetical protein
LTSDLKLCCCTPASSLKVNRNESENISLAVESGSML